MAGLAETVSHQTRAYRVALIGNPNTGKSTLFSALTEIRVRTGNYPGVTVEQRIGRVCWDGHEIDLIDLPGTYSLSPGSPDEMVAVEVLTGCGNEPAPDAVICICNAAALERNLYLVTQVLEIGVPVVLCLNMWDASVAAGIRIQLQELAKSLGVPVVATSASRKEGLTRLKEEIVRLLEDQTLRATEPGDIRRSSGRLELLPGPIQAEIRWLQDQLRQRPICESRKSGFLVSRCLLDPDGAIESLMYAEAGPSFREAVQVSRKRLADLGLAIPGAEANFRYQSIHRLVTGVVERSATRSSNRTDRLDAVLTHPVFGFAICACVLLLVFSTIYWFSAPLSDGIENLLGLLNEQIATVLAPGPLRSLLTEGVVSGVGAILVFLPQICFLFLFIGLLEDCGYMARAAFMMDRLMGLLGLSGRSFLPLMSSFACAVPGIMATRVIDDRRDRFVTILIAPLMSCSARLPVYVLMIGTFIPDTRIAGGWLSLRAVVLFLISSLGLIIAIPVAFLLRRTLFAGEPSPFLLELPDYRRPSLRVVGQRVFESATSFVTQAGTLIFATSVLVWAAGSFPGNQQERYHLMQQLEALNTTGEVSSGDRDQLENRLKAVNAELLRNSLLGQAGQVIEPVFAPLGWDWRIGVGVLASFPAREVIIATLGTIYALGGDVDEADEGLRGALLSAAWPDGRKVFSIPVALSIMVFFALCAQCVSTLMVIRRETGSWKWPLFSFGYMTALAWTCAFLTYQIGIQVIP